MIGTIFQAHYWLDSVGPNVAAVLPCGLLTFLWSRTKFWPLGALKRLEKSHEEIHRKLDDLAKS